MVRGNWGIKKMVGTKPAIIGKVLKTLHAGGQKPSRGGGSGGGGCWLEVVLDSASNR